MQYLVDNNSDCVEKAFEDKQLNNLLQVNNDHVTSSFRFCLFNKKKKKR